MKKLALILLTACIASVSVADFQAPPGSKYGRIRKLSRAVANLVYGINELPNQWVRSTQEGGNTEAATFGTLWASHKIIVRVGYGLYELVTFPFPTYKGSYRIPYKNKEDTQPFRGYQEFPPEVGFASGWNACREQVD